MVNLNDYSSIECKAIIFYDARYNKAFTWWLRSKEETAEVIRAWTALEVPAVGLYYGCSDGDLKVVPFDGYTVDDLKQYLAIAEPQWRPSGMKDEVDDQTLYIKVNPEAWGLCNGD
jgi:hypothetical protein